MLSPTRFRFLNEEHDIIRPEDWNRSDLSRLWLYNLHYFDDLDSVASEDRAAWHRSLIQRWIDENPVMSGVGWEPYCLSLRIVNWCRLAWSGQALVDRAIESLAVQVRALALQIEWRLLGNHLIANAKALIFAGLFFDGPEADQWLKLGLSIMTAELKEQVLADGGHYERSPMYHAIIAADVLELIEADRRAPGRLPSGFVAELRQLAPKMLSWAQAMRHSDGDIAFFNDAALGIAPPPADLTAMAERLGLEAPYADSQERRLKPSGYAVLGCGEARLLADVGPIGPDYIPGHAHADTLSFELSLAGSRLLVNTGTSIYADTPRRRWERSTAAHNTLTIDGENSSDVWGAFRVGRRARPFGVASRTSSRNQVLLGAHNGYVRLGKRRIHHREWDLDQGGLVVTDRLEGPWKSAASYWLFAPGSTLESGPSGAFLGRTPDGKAFKVQVRGAVARLEAAEWSPGFGVRQPTTRLVLDIRESVSGATFVWSGE
jgi:uncharacterized heparinase superfamily protein